MRKLSQLSLVWIQRMSLNDTNNTESDLDSFSNSSHGRDADERDWNINVYTNLPLNHSWSIAWLTRNDTRTAQLPPARNANKYSRASLLRGNHRMLTNEQTNKQTPRIAIPPGGGYN